MCAVLFSAEAALICYLEGAAREFNGRFLAATGRGFRGFSHAERGLEEGTWRGGYLYDFVQLADPQLGMLHYDNSWDDRCSSSWRSTCATACSRASCSCRTT
jgi:hypothetical protein